MRTQQLKWWLAAAAMCWLLNSATASAQTADALIDKLVDKGILTVKEANELREEADKNFTQAYAVKSGMPDWVSALKFNGDLRARFEGFYREDNAFVDRNRGRIRLRFGATATLFDNMEVGLRLTTSEQGGGGSFGGDPISGNTTLQDNGSKKFIYLDLAYAKYGFLSGPALSGALTVGKMENPFVFSDMVFDTDHTPEGLALQLTYNLSAKHTARLNGGFFLVDEIGASTQDPFWYGAQLRMDSAWSKKVQTTAGVAFLALDNEEFLSASRSSSFSVTGSSTNVSSSTTWTVPNQNAGNLRSPVTGRSGTVAVLQREYNPVVADVGITYHLEKFWHYSTAFPIRFAGDVLYNPGADSDNTGWQAGITFGKSGKKGLWEVGYRYKHLEGDAWFEEFPDSDFGAYYKAGSLRSAGATGYWSGTNVKGHIIKASYSPFDSLTLGVTTFLTELIEPDTDASDSAIMRLQVDAVWKF